MSVSDLETLDLSGPMDISLEASAADGAEQQPVGVRIAAYSGGLMTVAGHGPVVIDVDGIDLPETVQLLANHDNRIEAIMGSGRPTRIDGGLFIDGRLFRGSQHAELAIALTREGHPLQASVGAEPLEVQRIAKGRQVVVNGRTIRAEAESFRLVRRSRLKHVAIVANGADGNTSVNIAAQAAPSQESTDMEFTQWIEAQGFKLDELSEQQTALLRTAFDQQAGANGGPSATAGTEVLATAVADLRAGLAAETARVAAVRTICAGRHPDIEARAIGEGWDEHRTELAVLREERPKAPAIHARGGDGLALSDVIEAALCLTRKHVDVEKRFKPEVLDAADRQYRNIGFQQLFMMAAAANGYPTRPGETIHSGNIRAVLEHAFPPRSLNAC